MLPLNDSSESMNVCDITYKRKRSDEISLKLCHRCLGHIKGENKMSNQRINTSPP